MPIFVDPSAKVPVRLGPNTIYIRSKMSVKEHAEVQNEVRYLARSGEGGVEFTVGYYELALLVANIVAWEGPEFEHVPCIRANILKLDPRDPLVIMVGDEIGRRNPPKRESPDPNAVTMTGSTIDGTAHSLEPEQTKTSQSENTTP